MMENFEPKQAWESGWQEPPVVLPFETGKRELVFAVLAVVFGLLLVNCTLYYGFSLGFAVSMIGCVLCSAGYLIRSGHRLTGYSGTLLGMSILIAAGFARSDDGFVKFIMLCFLAVSVDLGLCLLAGQARRDAGGIGSLLDAPRSLFVMGVGQMSPAFRGMGKTLKDGGPAVRKGGAVLLGLLLAVPVLMVVIPLLMSADAAFDGLVGLLPELDLAETWGTVLFGVCAACVIYTRGVALKHKPKEDRPVKERKGISHLTVDTVLGMICLVYLVYLVSQLAYFVGGFAGILPEGFTLAEYARRGFFEMAWLCVIDLTVIAVAVGLVRKKDGKTPLSTKLFCLGIGAVTVFFVATASAKMLLYIDAYGLTRLRVLTEVIMVFLGLSTVIVTIWLFQPRLQYMKAILVLGLVMGALVFWVDVDMVVAGYNVSAYQSGRLERIDMDHLEQLGDGAMPYVAKLTRDADNMVAFRAKAILQEHDDGCGDLREWNFASWYAGEL